MRDRDQYNFLVDQTPENTSYFRRIVTECVLATDLAKSMIWLNSARLSLIKNENSPSSVGNNSISSVGVNVEIDEKKLLENKILRMQLIIKCSDVGHPARPLELHLEWSKRICEEFFNQGDIERSRGMKISPLCDRNVPTSSYPQGQIGFINFVSKPVFVLMSAVCSSVNESEKPWLTHMDNNVKYWQEQSASLTATSVSDTSISKNKDLKFDVVVSREVISPSR